MLILAFDTSSRYASASLLLGTRELGSAHGQGTARHGDTLLPLIERVLDQVGVARTELQLLVVGTGPGSFTGLRVGLAVAKGLALGLGCDLVGLPSAVALALAAAPQGGLVATATRAYRGEVYAGLHRVQASGVSSALPLFAASPAEALTRLQQAAADEAFVCVGDGFAPELIAELPAVAVRADTALDVPQARQLGLEGCRLFARRGPDDASALVPHYVRGADAQLPQSASASSSSR